MKKDTIVIIDDDLANIKLLQKTLLTIECQIETAISAEEGLKKINKYNPDLVLSDVKMPGMDGFQLTERLRACPETRDIPIILITGMDSSDLKLKGLEAGCDDFITKPYDLSELRVRVTSLLKLSYYRRQLNTREQLGILIEQMTDGLIITDKDYNIIQINKRAQKLISYKGPGGNAIEQIYKHYETKENSVTLREGSYPSSRILLFRRASSHANALFLQCDISYAESKDKDRGRIILFLEDVTEAQEEQRLKHDFLSLISHKLRSPIAVIAGMAGLIESTFSMTLDQKQKNIMEELKRNSIKMEHLVDKLIRFSTINNLNLVGRQNQPYNTLELMKEAAKHTIYFYSHKTVRTSYKDDLPEDFNCSIPTKDQFNFIIDNLVENAIKFSNDKFVTIDFRLWLEAEKLMISISDNGPGIPPEAQDKIFESFYQYEKIFTGNVEGMGIGLAMVKQILNNVGGIIELQSELNQGSTFTISLPLRRESKWNSNFEDWT